MLDSAKSSELSVPKYKKERLSYEKLGESTLPLESLKLLETELQKRWSSSMEDFYPLWFHAENERNIFLWKKALSLSDAGRFDFWVDIRALIDKRQNNLDAPNWNNPFTNPRWESDFPSSHGFEREQHYLNDISGAMSTIMRHAHALTVAGRLLLGANTAEIVILPGERRRESSVSG